MGPIEQFFWGFTGSLATETPSLSRALRAGRALPKRFRRVSYWLARLAIAVVAGLVTVAAQVQSPLLAMHVGAATPLLLDLWQRKPPRSLEGGA